MQHLPDTPRARHLSFCLTEALTAQLDDIADDDPAPPIASTAQALRNPLISAIVVLALAADK